jgi:sugar phosphate isomerase/epimerase
MGAIIALQLYTVRDETTRDFKSTLRRVAEIGYTAVEFAGYGHLSSQDMAALLADTGLQAIGSHVRLPALEKDFDREINYALDLGCTLLVIPSLEAKWHTSEGMTRLCPILNEYGRRAQERGVTLAYHNHDFEFHPDAAGELMINKLTAGTDPELLKLELDTFWTVFAGADPIGFIHKHPGRIVALHLKDMTPNHTFTEVGDGILDIAGYTKAAESGGTRIFIVENDNPSIPPLASARRSFENMRRSMEWW